jgi:hypothetical protein
MRPGPTSADNHRGRPPGRPARSPDEVPGGHDERRRTPPDLVISGVSLRNEVAPNSGGIRSEIRDRRQGGPRPRTSPTTRRSPINCASAIQCLLHQVDETAYALANRSTTTGALILRHESVRLTRISSRCRRPLPRQSSRRPTIAACRRDIAKTQRPARASPSRSAHLPRTRNKATRRNK